MEESELSVVMPNYNHGCYLPEALDAILAQSYQPSEVILIDDNSTDNSLQIMQDYSVKNPILHVYRNEENKGLIYSINRGLCLASGTYIYFAAADDRVLPEFFQKSMDLLKEYPEAGVCSTLVRLIDESGKDKGLGKSPIFSHKPCFIPPSKVSRILLEYGYWNLGVTSIFRRQALREIGGFAAELHSSCDIFTGMVVALRYGGCFIPEALAQWRIMPTGYYAKTSMNREHQIEMARYAGMLMCSQYRALFPSDYAKNFTNNRLFELGKAEWRSMCDQQKKFFMETLDTLCPHRSLYDTVVRGILLLMSAVQTIALKIYLLFRLRLVRFRLSDKMRKCFTKKKKGADRV
ncbi:MAG: glycosyltransferase family 2 protein [bacterium]